MNGEKLEDKEGQQPAGTSVTKDDDSNWKHPCNDDTTGKVVPYLSLYRCVDGYDTLAIILGLLGSFVNGLTFPAFSYIGGEVRSSSGIARGDSALHAPEGGMHAPEAV